MGWILGRVGSKIRVRAFFVCAFALVLLSGCTLTMIRGVRGPGDALVPLRPGWLPRFSDDLDRESLRTAVRESLRYFRSLPQDREVIFGRDRYPVSRMVSSLEMFLMVLNEGLTPEDLNRLVSTRFRVYQSVGRGWRRRVLFTGYYAPVVAGSLTPDARFQYPLYRRPDELIEVRLGLFSPRFGSQRIIGRLEDRRLVPFFTREEIDGQGFLEERGDAVVWLADRIERYFLQIQGSGIVQLPDGRYLRVTYDGTNGRPYRSIGKLLIDRGELTREEMSMQRIRSYLHDHPENMDEILFHDPSYTFFRAVEDERGPVGNIGVPLTTGRSIATDSGLFPKGGLAFIITEKPVIDDRGTVSGWERFSRFVVNQDTGGAIRGPARADLFWGEGEAAGMSAGPMKQRGKLFFLMEK